MAEYIEKSALVAEIDKRLHQLTDAAFDSMIGRNLIEIKDFINTLEVKELQEEPVSEDLIDATNNYCVNVRKGYPRVMDETDKYICNAFRAGANWQKAKDQSTIELAEDHAMLAGMEKMKEQMMKDAIDVEVKVDAGGYPYIDKTIELYDYDKDIPLAKKGDKYKVVLIKKD